MNTLRELKKEELMKINGGGDNCPLEKGKSINYYIGYFLGWIFD